MFSSLQVSSISKAMNLAVGKAGRTSHLVASAKDDITQSAWVKILTSYTAENGTPEAFAYRVTYREAIDYLRNRGAKSRTDSRFVSTDADVTDDEGCSVGTMGEALASAPVEMLDNDSDATQWADVLAVLPTLGESQRAAIEAHLADASALTGAQRIAKMRAIDAIRLAVL